MTQQFYLCMITLCQYKDNFITISEQNNILIITDGVCIDKSLTAMLNGVIILTISNLKYF